MPRSKWSYTVKGKARRLYDAFVKRHRDKGFTICFKANEFYPKFLNATICPMCDEPFGEDRKYRRSVFVNVKKYREIKNINIDDIEIMHYKCTCSKRQRRDNENCKSCS